MKKSFSVWCLGFAICLVGSTQACAEEALISAVDALLGTPSAGVKSGATDENAAQPSAGSTASAPSPEDPPAYILGDPRPALSLTTGRITALTLNPGLGPTDLDKIAWHYDEKLALPGGIGKVTGGGDTVNYVISTPTLAADAPLSAFSVQASMNTGNTGTLSSTASKSYDLTDGLTLHGDQSVSVSRTADGDRLSSPDVVVNQKLGFDIGTIDTTATFGVSHDVSKRGWTGTVSAEKKVYGPFVLDASVARESTGETEGTVKAGINLTW